MFRRIETPALDAFQEVRLGLGAEAAEGGDLVGLFPRESGLAEVPVVGGLAVNRAESGSSMDEYW